MTTDEQVRKANALAAGAGRAALAELVDRDGIVAGDLWRWLIKKGAAK